MARRRNRPQRPGDDAGVTSWRADVPIRDDDAGVNERSARRVTARG